MQLAALETLTIEELKAVVVRSNELLKERDRKQRDETIRDVLARLAAAGLKPTDVLTKKAARTARPPVFKPKAGHIYQHPDNPGLQCPGNGNKPKWWHELRRVGKEPIDLGPAVRPPLPQPTTRTNVGSTSVDA